MSEGPAQVVAGWEVGPRSDLPSSFEDLNRLRELWVDTAAVVACWPGLPVSIERRIVIEGSGSVREFLLISVLGLGRADVRSAVCEATALISPLLERTQATSLKPHQIKLLTTTTDGITDIAEIRGLSRLVPEGPRSLATSMFRTVALAQASLDAKAALIASFLISTPAPLAPESATPLGFVGLPRRWMAWREGERPVRFRLRLAATTALPRSVLAAAATIAVAPIHVGGSGWHRPRTDADLRIARGQLARLGSAEWGIDKVDQTDAATTTVATVMCLPLIASVAVTRPDRSRGRSMQHKAAEIEVAL